MLLNTQEFSLKAQSIFECPDGSIGFDFETTGLRPYKGNQAFLLGFTDSVGEKYSVRVERSTLFQLSVARLFGNSKLTYCAHNAKFELGFLHAQFGVEVAGPIWDTEVMARVEYNSHFKYDLQSCAQRIGESKFPAMLEWLKIRGNKNLYHKAPDELIIPYVEQDAWLSWRLRQHQDEIFTHWNNATTVRISNVVNLEQRILPHLFEMERNGLLVDVAYCKKAYEYEQEKIAEARGRFEHLSGVGFVDSRKTLKPVFDTHGIRYGQTELGNASFTEDSLAASRENPIVATVLAHRRALKRSSSYWLNFLDLEHNGIIHPSINQNKAQTGRMSISDPSCQNWSTDEDEGTAFPIRRAFIARPGCVIASLDYSQMELRKGADEADDFPMIERIVEGADLHQEIADMADVRRSLAKNGRFAKQYGAGIPKIAATLGVTEMVARKISDAIDRQAQAMTAYSYGLAEKARGSFGYDWLGRRFYFDPGFEYKAFNYRIQGGCAEILKIAILKVGEFLKANARPESFMLIPVHDELIANMHKDDLHLLSEIKQLMIEAHLDKKFLAMDVNVAVGPNIHDLEEFKC